MAHSCGTGIIATALGYAIKASPGPGKKKKHNVLQGCHFKQQTYTSHFQHKCTGWNFADRLDPQSPDSATVEMSVSCSLAMKPNTEKMAKPATKLVALFNRQR